MPLPPRQSLPPPIPFGPAPTSGVVSTDPILDIPSSSGPSEPVLETITSPFRDDDTGGDSFHESPPRPHPATPTISPTVGVAKEPLTLTSLLALFPTCLQRIATLEAEFKATKILYRDTVVLLAKRIKKLESKLKPKKRKLVLSDSENEEEERQSKELDALLDLANAAIHEPRVSTPPSKPAHPGQSSEQEISPTTLDAVLTLSKSKARARAATIIYKRLKKKKSSSGLDFMDANIPTGGLDFAGGLDSADQQATILEAERQELLEQELKQSIDAEQVYLDNLLAQRVAEEQDRESMASAVQLTERQAELDRVALNLTTEEWIGLVDQVRANLTLSAELLGVDVSEDTFSVRMVELMNRRRKAIAEMKSKAKRKKPMTPAQQKKEFMRTFVKNQSETLESLESKKLKSSHSTTQPVELQETTSVSAGVPIAAVDLISAGFSVFAASSILAATPIAAGVSITTDASGSASEASVPIIELLDSPPKDTSLQLDPESKEQDVLLRKSSRKKSIARKRTLPSPSKPKSDALTFDEFDPKAEFKRYLRQASDDDEPAEPVSLALVSNITTWEIIPTEFRRGEIHVIIRADGTVKRFSTLRELMYWAGRVDLMVLYGLVSDKYKTERATDSDCSECCRSLANTLYPASFCTCSIGSESVPENKSPAGMKTCQQKQNTLAAGMTITYNPLLNWISSKPKTLDETIELANDFMDQKLRTNAERQTNNKRKANELSKNNQGHQQQPAKRQNVAKVYNMGSGHFKRDCPKLKNKDGGNVNAQGWVYAVGNVEKKGNASRDPNSNVVTGRFLLNNRYASILFDTGHDRSFISTAFGSLIDIFPTPLGNSYDVELAGFESFVTTLSNGYFVVSIRISGILLGHNLVLRE
nr:putative reverse transcriptase domain-containing protein [Tanacetum cinerariifolium]